jgi:hypothetical protein
VSAAQLAGLIIDALIAIELGIFGVARRESVAFAYGLRRSWMPSGQMGALHFLMATSVSARTGSTASGGEGAG